MKQSHIGQRVLAAAVALTISIVVPLFAHAQNGPTVLSLKDQVERPISGDEVQDFQIKLKRGQYVCLEALPTGTDLFLTLIDPSGKTVAEVDGDTNYIWIDRMDAIVENDGLYTLRIKGVGPKTYTGKYTLKITDLRKPTAADRQRVEATRLVAEAIKLGKINKNKEASDLYSAAIKLWNGLGDRQWSAICTWDLAWAYLKQEDDKTALGLHAEALAAFRALNDRIGESAALNAIAFIYRFNKRFADSRKSFEDGLTIRRQLDRRRGIANTLFSMGELFTDMGLLDDALATFDEAAAIYQEISDISDRADTLVNLARTFAKLHRDAEARQRYDEAVQIYLSLDANSADATDALFNLSQIYQYKLNDLDNSRASLEKACEIWRRRKDVGGESLCLIALGGLYQFSYQNPDKAIEYFASGLAAAIDAKRIGLESLANIGLGSAYQSKLKYKEALEYYLKAEKVVNGNKGVVNELLLRSSMGSVYVKLGENEKAKEQYLRQIEVIGADQGDAGASKSALGLIYFNQGEFEKSRDTYLESVKLLHRSGDKTSETIALGGAGLAQIALGDTDGALESFRAELDLAKKTGNLANEYLAHLGFAEARTKVYDPETAKLDYQNALQTARDLKNKGYEAAVLVALGNLYADTSGYERSQELETSALTIYREIGDKDGESSALNNIGRALLSLGELEKSRPYFDQALAIKLKTGTKRGLDMMYNNVGVVANTFGEYDKARDMFDSAATVNSMTRNQQVQSLILSGRGGLLFSDRSQYEKAKAQYEQALQIALKNRDNREEGIAEDGLGTICKRLGLYDEAKTHYERALLLFRQSKNKGAQAAVENNLGDLYGLINSYATARPYFDRALAIRREIKDRRGEGDTLNDMGRSAMQAGDLSSAEADFLSALAIFEQIKLKSGTGASYANLGEVQIRLKRFPEADTSLKNALTIFTSIGNRYGEAQTLANMGLLAENKKQLNEARVFDYQALAVFRDLRSRQDEGDVLRHLMQISMRSGQAEAAALYGKSAINAFQEGRGNLRQFDKDSQQSYLKGKESAYRTLADLLISIDRFAEAQMVLGLLKEQEYESVTAKRDGPADIIPYSTAESALMQRIENFAALERRRVELEKLKSQRADLFADPEKAELAQINEEIVSANSELVKALSQLGNSQPTAKEKIDEIEARRNVTTTLQQFRSENGSGAVALFTVIGSETTATGRRSKFGWVIMQTPKGRKAYPIDVSNLDDTVLHFREALSDPKIDPRVLAAKLYNAIFRQTSARQKTTLETDLAQIFGNDREPTIMWSLDGVLRYVPMAALYDGKQYLLQKYRHLIFTKQDNLQFDTPRVTWRALGMGVSQSRENFAALPGVKQELEDIIHQPDESSGIVAGTRVLDGQFTKAAALSLWDDPQYTVVHIASHFSFNPADEGSSFLLVGDGKITLSELRNRDGLFNAVDLITLSACDTAMSGNGKESESFAALAQTLGARSVIASLWPISDKGTPEFMLRFYKLRAEHPDMSKGEAFRQAQLSMLGDGPTPPGNALPRRGAERVKSDPRGDRPPFVQDPDKPFSHPYYWAPYILIGNWR